MCCLFGLADGCFVTMMGPVSFDIVGNKGASQGLGYALLSMSIFMTSGPPTAGKIFDVTKSLKLPFYLAGGAAFLGSLVLCISPRRRSSKDDGNFSAEVSQFFQKVKFLLPSSFNFRASKCKLLALYWLKLVN